LRANGGAVSRPAEGRRLERPAAALPPGAVVRVELAGCSKVAWSMLQEAPRLVRPDDHEGAAGRRLSGCLPPPGTCGGALESYRDQAVSPMAHSWPADRGAELWVDGPLPGYSEEPSLAGRR